MLGHRGLADRRRQASSVGDGLAPVISTATGHTARYAADGAIQRVETTDRQVDEHSPSLLVSVIIPTLHRPALLMRALASVFCQTWRELEVIVVVDGPDLDTIAVLRTIGDPRLRIIVNARSLTAAGARNAGMDQARGKWIAFLDDDDEWLPEKLAKQLAYSADCGPALITCLSRVVTPTESFVRPQVIFDNILPIDEYLFDRQSPFAGRGFIQTSSYLLPRTLCRDLRFRTDTPHDDWDFLLRLSKEMAVRVETVPEILVNLYVEDARPSLSKSGTWLSSLEWAERIRPLLTPRAYSGFCLGVVGPRAAKERARHAWALLLYRTFRGGSPRLWRVAAFLALWLAPKDMLVRKRRTGRNGSRD
jgi:glycosyltransferase involved in cell wall biosynthesis